MEILLEWDSLLSNKMEQADLEILVFALGLFFVVVIFLVAMNLA